jgi:tRNA U34 5-methylaminomethyl-2-thiouridine-forming methyltransferase MnmC
MEISPHVTGDGSLTFHVPELDEHYHSVNGAIAESQYVFIDMGLKSFYNRNISLLEIGFGTGLNAYLSLINAESLNLNISYTGIDLFPLSIEYANLLNYPDFFDQKHASDFKLLHSSPWNGRLHITDRFAMNKIKADFLDFSPGSDCYDLVFFDAFSPKVQPELWTDNIFIKIYDALNPSGILVTYSAKGNVKRSLLSAGFQVEKLKGPPGKRHMLRAIKK